MSVAELKNTASGPAALAGLTASVVAVNLLIPEVGVVPLVVRAKDLDDVLAQFERNGYLDGINPDTHSIGRFYKPLSAIFERTANGTIARVKPSIIQPQ